MTPAVWVSGLLVLVVACAVMLAVAKKRADARNLRRDNDMRGHVGGKK